jgi:Short C-terminal domain
MAILGKKPSQGSGDPGTLETYKVVYIGGLAELPKAKFGEIRLLLTATQFELRSTIGSKSFWTDLTIPYRSVTDLQIVRRQASTFESAFGGRDAKWLDEANNIHIQYLVDGRQVVLRLEMLSGLTVPGQAKRCREFEDRLRVLGIRDQFQTPVPAAAGGVDVADQIAKLADLRDRGVLTPAEFDARKAQLLNLM